MSQKKAVWFEEWFNTSYYHTLYQHRDENEAEKFIDALLAYLDIPPQSKCLDLACGKGRHSIYLNKKGLDVVGLDLSQNSIQKAKQHENNHLKFDVHDMRKVYRENYFQFIFNLFTSFGYFDSNEDNLNVLTSIKKMLVKNGCLVIDFMNATKVIENLVEKEVKSIDGVTFNIKRWTDKQHIFKQIDIDDNGDAFQFTERVQILEKADFERLLSKAGFKVKEMFGNFNLDLFNEKNSDRLIIIATN